MNIQNQQNILPIVKRVRYNKAGYYLVVKFLSRNEYKDELKLRFSIKSFCSKWEQIRMKLKFTFTKENFSGKFHFLGKDRCIYLTFKIMLTRYNPFFYVFCKCSCCVYQVV